MTDEEKQLFTPQEAADYLTQLHGRRITVARLAQLRRAGKVKAQQLGYNVTVYTLEDLNDADVSLDKPGRKSGDEQQLDSEDDPIAA